MKELRFMNILITLSLLGVHSKITRRPTMLFRRGTPIKWKLKIKDFKKGGETK